jgi:glycosyl transferase family 87
VTGALVLLAGGALLAFGSLRAACLLSPRSTASFLLAVYVAAWVQLVLVLWALSVFDWVSRWWLLGALAVVCAALTFDTRGRSDIGARVRESGSALREALGEPVAVVLGLAVLTAFGYAVALGLGTPQNDFDTLVDHLWRAGLWFQNAGAGYPDCDCAPYINAYPPHAELGVLATMALGGSDRYVALVQATAYLALVLGVIGVARALRLRRAEALVAGLLVGTLPVIALQSSTAQNDLVVASFVVAGVVFLLDRYSGAAPWLAGAATALAVGTKVTALIAIPLLLVVAFAAWPERKGPRLAAVVLGGIAGSYWYVVNWRHTGSWDGGFPYVDVDRSVAPTVARGLRSAIQLVELPGGVGRDRWLFAVTAVLLFAGLVAFAWRSDRGRALRVGAIAAAIALLPVLTPDARRYVDQSYRDLWRALGRNDLALEVGRDITISASNVSWYGPLGALLLVCGLVAAVVAARRGLIPGIGAVLAFAPVYWLVALSVSLFYQDAAGRFLMAPVALAGATWGLAPRVRPVAWGLAAIGITALGLAVLNDSKRPSGIPLLQRPAPASYWTTPRWEAQGREVHVPDLIRFVDARVDPGARVGLAITPSDAGYVFFGPHLDRRLDLLPAGVRDAPGAGWVFVSPSARETRAPQLCSAWRRLPASPSGWGVYRRSGRC